MNVLLKDLLFFFLICEVSTKDATADIAGFLSLADRVFRVDFARSATTSADRVDYAMRAGVTILLPSVSVLAARSVRLNFAILAIREGRVAVMGRRPVPSHFGLVNFQTAEAAVAKLGLAVGPNRY